MNVISQRLYIAQHDVYILFIGIGIKSDYAIQTKKR